MKKTSKKEASNILSAWTAIELETKRDKKKVKNVLSAWTVLEILSPQTFKKERDLGDAVSFNKIELPWEAKGEKTSEQKKSYQVVIGMIPLEKARAALLRKYPSNCADEFSSDKKKAIMGVILVDHKGCLLKDSPAVSLSSFAWGLSRALNMNLESLNEWPTKEPEILQAFDQFLRQRGEARPLDKRLIKDAHDYLVKEFKLPEGMVEYTPFAIRTCGSFKKNERPQPILLNSFYLADLLEARRMFETGNVSDNLKRYLGMEPPVARHDLLYNHKKLEAAVAPQLIPPARWPSAPTEPLALLQQAAVNLAMHTTKEGGILAVNGPPGTGKTTLLRDIIAGVITQRAEVLCTYDDPASAFTNSGIKIEGDTGTINFYTIDDQLKGFEILFAAINNKAVENICAELPNLKTVVGDASDLRYFNVISDKLSQCKTWGLISAVLGKSEKRHSFRSAFWDDKDIGLNSYLLHAAGVDQSHAIDIYDPDTGRTTNTRAPHIVEYGDPPKNRQDALERWKKARAHFQTVLGRSQTKLAALEEMRSVFKQIDDFEPIEIDKQHLAHLLEAHRKNKPGFFSYLFRWNYVRTWKKQEKILLDQQKKHEEILANRQKLILQAEQYSNIMGETHIINNALFTGTREILHQTSPWCDQEVQTLRSDVFVAAMKLHKAFIDAAAKPLRDNLSIFDKYLSGKFVPTGKSTPDLWSSFCLVVPCVSTTFASVDKMLRDIPQEGLGWLLIDEAGQATPQSAVGAIVRTKRAIVVGDPLQLESVVTLSERLTERIFLEFGVDPKDFNAPEASAQTLADKATAYCAEFQGRKGSRVVGVPLLAHRRCANPMFNISNTIAYGRTMIHVKRPQPSPIRNCLGPSAWFDVRGDSEDKWCSEEGEKLIELLSKLVCVEGPPDLYIITPFRTVAKKITERIRKSGLLKTWGITNSNVWLAERVGTIHTAQGREAEAVILVLGAPAIDQRNARFWASASPNLLNVAVTRAKEVIYVIGNIKLWNVFLFHELIRSIEIISEKKPVEEVS